MGLKNFQRKLKTVSNLNSKLTFDFAENTGGDPSGSCRQSSEAGVAGKNRNLVSQAGFTFFFLSDFIYCSRSLIYRRIKYGTFVAHPINSAESPVDASTGDDLDPEFRFRVKFLKGNVESSKRKGEEKYSRMTPISHGLHVIEDKSLRSGSGYLGSDSIVAQREQIQDQEVWMFGVFDVQMGDGIIRYLKSHLFDKKLNEIRRKSKETMKTAYLSAGTKLHEGEKENQGSIKKGSASAIVINGEKVVAAYMADYRAVICRDGVAKQIGKRQCRAKRHWPLNLIAGAWRMPNVCIIGCETSDTGNKPSTSEPVVRAEKIDSDAEFLILASNGIWEVMNNQEAVNLIRHMDDPQAAAECLTKEALTRISRSNISCLVIRFD